MIVAEGAEILLRYVQDHVFMHDDSLEVPGASHDEYTSHPIMLGAAVVLSNSFRLFGNRYSTFLRDIGCWPDRPVEPREYTTSPLKNVVRDPLALDALASSLGQSQGIGISAFYPYRSELDVIARSVHGSEERRGALISPLPAAYARWSNRSTAADLLREMGLPTLPGRRCNTSCDLGAFATEQRKPFLLKSDSYGIALIRTDDDLKDAESLLPGYAELYVHAKTSPNLQVINHRGGAALLVCEQIVQDFKHRGNRSLDADTPALMDKLMGMAERLLPIAGEVGGPVGFDAIVTDDDSIYIVDVNPRFNSCTYPVGFASRQTTKSAEWSFIYENVHGAIATLEQVALSAIFPMYSASRQRGSLLFGPAALAIDGPVSSAFLLTIAAPGDVDHVHKAALVAWRAMSAANRAFT